jgi:putative ABC transport system substrate-binding protein
LSEIVRQLVADKVDVIVASNNQITEAAITVTRSIPIVMTGNATPVEFGYVKSLAKPGTNVTGFSFEVGFETGGKRLELIRDLLPDVKRLAYLPSIALPPAGRQFIEQAAAKLGFNLLVAEHKSVTDYEQVLVFIAAERPGSLFVSAGPDNFANRHAIIQFAARNRLPSMYVTRGFVEAGGLMSYGADVSNLNRRGAEYVHRILRGENPADMAVEQPSKYELVLNLKTTKAIGLTIPPLFLARADEMIE